MLVVDPSATDLIAGIDLHKLRALGSSSITNKSLKRKELSFDDPTKCANYVFFFGRKADFLLFYYTNLNYKSNAFNNDTDTDTPLVFLL